MQAPDERLLLRARSQVSGKLISAEKIGKVTWAERIDVATGRPVEAKNIRYETGDVISGRARSARTTGRTCRSVPGPGWSTFLTCRWARTSPKGEPAPGAVAVGGLSIGWAKADPQDGKGALLAWDPVAQKARWKIQLDTLWNGGTLATAGDLVFQGTADGYFSAYDASTANRLWQFNAGLGIIAAPISFAAHGKQYVSVLVGYGGSAAIGSNIMHLGWKYGAQPQTAADLRAGWQGSAAALRAAGHEGQGCR